MHRALLGAATAAAALLLVTGAGAAPNQATGVTVTAAFSDPQPAGAVLVCGFPSTPPCSEPGPPVQVRWGVPFSGEAEHSGLGFLQPAAGSSVDLGTNFSLGTLTHFNFQTVAGTSVTDLVLDVGLTATTPDGPLTASLALPIHIDETPNVGAPADCAYQPVTTLPCPDALQLPPGFQQTVSIPGSTHTYTLSILGFAQSPTSTSPLTSLVTQEELESSAFLIARLTRNNAAPAAGDDSASTPVATPVTVDVLNNDTDADGDALTPALAAAPAHGTAVLNADGTVTYTPDAAFAGTDSFTYVDSDGYAQSNEATVTIDVVDQAPVCSASPSVQTLRPPNHALVQVALSGATDPDVGDVATIEITGVTQDEALTGGGSGSTAFDAEPGATASSVWLRVERAGTGDGRVYTIAYTATDSYGQSCAGTADVTVPHDRAHPAVATAGVSVDSFGS